MNQINAFHPENELDLQKLWLTLLKRKTTIFYVMLISSLLTTIFTWTRTPVYSGNALLEVGEVVNYTQVLNNQPTIILKLDEINNLKVIAADVTGANITIPDGTTNILQISVQDTDKAKIQSKLESAIQFILSRHHEKAKLYQSTNSKIKMTQVIREIQITNDPIQPKKQLIITIALICGLILGIFLALFIEFLKSFNR